jgi:small subunit ribosomal protein S3
MSQVSHPYGFRLVNVRDWKSRWFSTKPEVYREFLRADVLMREYLQKRLRGQYISTIEFERNRDRTRVILSTSRPGIVIGRNGDGAKKLRADIAKFIRRNNLAIEGEVKLDIVEITNPEADAMIVAQTVEEGLRRRLPFRRVIKQALEATMGARGVKGCRIQVSGLIGGSATMARREQVKRGPIPLQFIRADIDYAEHAVLGQGVGIKVWINKGDSLVAEADRK